MRKKRAERRILLRNHIVAAVVLVLVDLLCWAAVVNIYQGGDVTLRWQTYLAVWQALLLFDTLLVVWLYTFAAQQQVEVGREQHQLAVDQATAASRPVVVIAWTYVPPPGPGFPAGWKYVVRNIGPGIAINTFYVEDLEAPDLTVVHLGALGPGDSIEVPEAIRTVLVGEENDALRRKRHVVLAQPVTGNTWVASGNLMQNGKRLSHRVKVLTLTQEQHQQLDRETPREYVHRNWPAIQADLGRMIAELRNEQ
jgi:hypothetical protein